ncbi:MAG: 16S rRNA (cytosine(1402)-N(4))-methyltransferase RsmH [Patescibacteria group bacterium]
MNDYHTPVLLDTAIKFLNVRSGNKYIDATLGGGGHASLIKSKGGLVLGIDQDQDAINNSKNLVDLCVKSNFIHLEEVAKNNNWYPVSGVLLDLGVSVHQIEDSSRGFSYQVDGNLDMRMGNSAVTAAELVNQLSVDQLTKIFKDFGEEPKAKFYAQRIVNSRPILTTLELSNLIGDFSSTQRIFQALRIAVNDELGSLMQVIPQIKNILDSGGRVVIISFHSLEDRIVKQEFNHWAFNHLGNVLTKKPIEGERGSKLRAFEKI